MKKIFLILLLGVITTLSSCKNSDDPTQQGSISGYDQGELSQMVYADQTSTDTDFSFTAAEAWTTIVTAPTRSSEEYNWVSVYPESGVAGPADLKIQLTANESGESRLADIKIICGESVLVISLEQSAQTEDGATPMPTVVKSVLINTEATNITEPKDSRASEEQSDVLIEAISLNILYGANNTVSKINYNNTSDNNTEIILTSDLEFVYSGDMISYRQTDGNFLPLTPVEAYLNGSGLVEYMNRTYSYIYASAAKSSAFVPEGDFYESIYNENGNLVQLLNIMESRKAVASGSLGASEDIDYDTVTYNYSWNNGNCIMVLASNLTDTINFEYTEHSNLLNVDILTLSDVMSYGTPNSWFTGLNLYGTKSQMLPSKYSRIYYVYGNKLVSSYTFEYTFGQKGELVEVAFQGSEENYIASGSYLYRSIENTGTIKITY